MSFLAITPIWQKTEISYFFWLKSEKKNSKINNIIKEDQRVLRVWSVNWFLKNTMNSFLVLIKNVSDPDYIIFLKI